MADLAALAERIEAAEGPDRKLDALIAFVVGHKHGRIGEWANRENGDYIVIAECAAAYTASLDAAMTLVPEGADFTLDRITRAAFVPCNASVLRKSGNAATPALALAAAALRARSQGGTDNG